MLSNIENNNGVKIPTWASTWKFDKITFLPIDRIYISIRHQNNNNLRLSIYETPHYQFINEYMRYGNNFKWSQTEYYKYAKKYINGKKSVSHFLTLFLNIRDQNYLKRDYEKNLCLVYRRFPIGRYILFDGLHRLAILAALGVSTVKVAIIVPKLHWLIRLIKKIKLTKNVRR